MLQPRRWAIALLILTLPGLTVSFGQDKDKDKKAAEKKDDKKDPAKKEEPKKEEKPAAPAPTGDAVDLKWKFEKDKTFFQDLSTETKQTLKVMGMEIVQNQKQTFVFSWTPEKQDEKDKSWVIKQKIEGVKMDIEIGGNKIQFDSTKDSGTGNPLADFFKAIVGSEFKLTVGPDLKVIKVEGREEFLKKLAGANQQMEPLLKTILSDEALKQMADPTFAAVPTKAVKKGETWDRKSPLNMGPIGTYENTYKYTFEGQDEKTKLYKIKVDTQLTYKAPDASAQTGLPFSIKSANLKSKDATGQVLFDNTKGRVDSSETNLKLEGELEITIGNQATKVDLSQTQKTTLKSTDDNPLGKK